MAHIVSLTAHLTNDCVWRTSKSLDVVADPEEGEPLVLEAEIAVDVRFVGREEAKRGQAVPDVHPHLRALSRDVLRLRSEPVRGAELQEPAASSHYTERHDHARAYYVPAVDVHFDREASLGGERRRADDVHEQPAVAAKNCQRSGTMRDSCADGIPTLTDFRWAHRGRPCPRTASLIVARRKHM